MSWHSIVGQSGILIPLRNESVEPILGATSEEISFWLTIGDE
ncbi:MAG: hypothetical protein VYA84_13705 [Planctomycetota bacterium]|nr:hypothetical protein [Planctomycetota bacterium]